MLTFSKLHYIGLISFVAIASAPSPADSISVRQVPNPRQSYGGWVTDSANLLSDTTEAKLNQMLSALEKENGSEIAVVTVTETSPSQSPKAFATELFNTWGIGKKGRDNGVLLLVSKRDRQVEIETGFGIEAILPSASVKQLIDSQMIPHFKQGDFDRGTLDGTIHLIQALQSPASRPEPEVAPPVASPSHAIGNGAENILLIILSGAGALLGGGLLYQATRRTVRLQPGGRSHTQRQAYSDELTGRTPRCSSCGSPMHKVTLQALLPLLNDIEQATQHLGSVKHVGWQCTCQSSIHVRGYVWNQTAYKKCPDCKALTTTFHIEVLEEATRTTTGRQAVTEYCVCCDYHQAYEEKISRLPDPAKIGASGSAAAMSGLDWGGGSGGASGGASSGGFGGGSSGGGGAGGGW